VVGVATSAAGYGCGSMEIDFKISPKLGFFVVQDENVGEHWGPFDSSTLAANGWTLNLTAGS
jgi:hypothetical protein